ncbi:MAG: Uma2 family endonuclease [Chitinophagaceae bacterium]|nr:Uma2 family endonuclease [Chitinophagaceae bacterium]
MQVNSGGTTDIDAPTEAANVRQWNEIANFTQSRVMVTSLNQLDTKKKYSYADYLTWWFEERVELIKGKIFKMSPAPSSRHQRISFELSGIIRNFLHGKEYKAFSAPIREKLMKKAV